MGKDIDTTTFVPEEFVDETIPDRDPTAPMPGVGGQIRTPPIWRCRFCGYSLVDAAFGKCYNCGRDFIGEEQGVPDVTDKPARPQVRSDGR